MKTVTDTNVFQELPVHERRQWYIPESVTTVFPIEDNGEKLVLLQDLIRDAGVQMVFAPVNPDNEQLHMREGAAWRLVEVAKELAQRSDGIYALKITDAFRPLALQRKYFTEITEQIQEKEGLTGQALWERVTEFVADPELCPPHSTGGATDLTITNLTTGEDLDMGTSVDTVDDRSNTWTEDISDEAKANRQLLWEVMTGHGFVNLASEWWHYSFGDQYWAIFTNQSAAIYGSRESV